MIMRLVFVCLVAKFTSTSFAEEDTLSGTPAMPQQPLVEAYLSSESSPLIRLQEKIEELERKHDSLMEEIDLLRKPSQKTDGEQAQHQRTRRSVFPGDMASLPTDGCIPGTNGCPISVTPFSIAGYCFLCPSGPRGYPGPAGLPGRDGRDVIGGIESPCREDATPSSNTSGAVYIRWGHHNCPSSSTLIYSGTAAAPSHLLDGNGADQLCLPPDPTYDQPVAGVGEVRAFLHGIEYFISNFPSHNDRKFHDVPCAVCQAPLRFAHLMIPGKNTCPSDEWTLEYGGYLMAERSHSVHHRSLHVCVDREMEVLARTSGGPANNARAYISLVEARCSAQGGGVPCGPYFDGYEITCAVCTM